MGSRQSAWSLNRWGNLAIEGMVSSFPKQVIFIRTVHIAVSASTCKQTNCNCTYSGTSAQILYKYGDVYGDDLTRQIFTRYGLNHICDIDLWLWFRFLEIGIYDLTRKNRGVMGIPSSWENHARWRMMDLTNGEFSWIIRTQLMSNIPSGVITAGWEIHTSSWHLNGKIIELNGSFSTTPRLITRRYQSQQKICRDVNPNRWGAHQ